MNDHPSLKRLGTGITALDRVLGGGFPTGSVIMIAGEPGTGKTVLTLQIMFSLARRGHRCLYVTTLSEPSLKVIHFMQQLGFFDQRLLDDHIALVDVGTIAQTQGVEEALAQVKDRIESDQPDLIAIDSIKALHDFVGTDARGRAVLYDLAVSVAAWGATTLLVGEYVREDFARFPEFAIADGIIHLMNLPQELTSLRQLEVLKLRGTDYVTGRHFFEMSPRGITFYPRVRMPQVSTDGATSTTERVTTGVPGLDQLLGGGVPVGSTTYVQGGTGVGKTLLGLHFLVEGARRGERGLLVTLEETLGQLRGIARNFGWNLQGLESQGQLTLTYTSPVELSTDRLLHDVREQVEGIGARRLVLDSLTSAALGAPSPRRFQELVYALNKHLRLAGVTSFMTVETPELLGSATLGSHGISPAADNVVLLRYVELDGHLERAMTVLKARGVNLRSELRRLTIGRDGLEVGPVFTGLRGVLTGLPDPEKHSTGTLPPEPDR
jgi:circadian clock protein KaiC